MESYEYCIIGGGPSGVGFLDRLIQEGRQDIMLFEGRGELLYTLSLMSHVTQTSAMFPGEVEGTVFREQLLERKRPKALLSLSSRLIGVDAQNSSILINLDGRENHPVRYRHLIIATGGVQAVYGSRLLPGFRGAGIFSTYQTAEMLKLCDFIPGKRLAVLGESPYAEETYRMAQEQGLAAVFLSNGRYTGAVPYAEVLGLEGQEHLDGITIRTPEGKTRHFTVDSLAVDGEFIMEHTMRDLLAMEWDIDRWQAETGDNQSHPTYPSVHITGDAWKPTFNFLNQYENGFNLAGRIL